MVFGLDCPVALCVPYRLVLSGSAAHWRQTNLVVFSIGFTLHLSYRPPSAHLCVFSSFQWIRDSLGWRGFVCTDLNWCGPPAYVGTVCPVRATPRPVSFVDCRGRPLCLRYMSSALVDGRIPVCWPWALPRDFFRLMFGRALLPELGFALGLACPSPSRPLAVVGACVKSCVWACRLRFWWFSLSIGFHKCGGWVSPRSGFAWGPEPRCFVGIGSCSMHAFAVGPRGSIARVAFVGPRWIDDCFASSVPGGSMSALRI